MTSNLFVDVMSLLKQVITTIFYIIMMKIKFIILFDRYYVSCHVKVLHAAFKRKVSTTYLIINYPLSITRSTWWCDSTRGAKQGGGLGLNPP